MVGEPWRAPAQLLLACTDGNGAARLDLPLAEIDVPALDPAAQLEIQLKRHEDRPEWSEQFRALRGCAGALALIDVNPLGDDRVERMRTKGTRWTSRIVSPLRAR